MWHWTSASPECVTIFIFLARTTTRARCDPMATMKIKRKSSDAVFVCHLSFLWLCSFYKINTEWEGEQNHERVRRWTQKRRRNFRDFVVWKVNLGELNSAQFADFHFNRKFFEIFEVSQGINTWGFIKIATGGIKCSIKKAVQPVHDEFCHV